MNDEERAKYACQKDKENLDKALKSGRSFTYTTQRTRKEIAVIIAIYGVMFTILFAGMLSIDEQLLIKKNQIINKLVVQTDHYIQKDFKSMNCVQKNVFIEKYSNDLSIYGHQEMKDWLQQNFDDNCVGSK